MPRSYLRYKEGPDLNLPPSPPSPLFVATPLHNIKLNKMVKERQKKKKLYESNMKCLFFIACMNSFQVSILNMCLKRTDII